MVNDRAAIVNDLAGYAKQYANFLHLKRIRHAAGRTINRHLLKKQNSRRNEGIHDEVGKGYVKNTEDAYKRLAPITEKYNSSNAGCGKAEFKSS
ncbi:MAG: hypothetical protein IPH68_15625 [Chitinophagaceae bacterium]|nr:hypothetical protein [Chitinophagaceae bacterium]